MEKRNKMTRPGLLAAAFAPLLFRQSFGVRRALLVAAAVGSVLTASLPAHAGPIFDAVDLNWSLSFHSGTIVDPSHVGNPSIATTGLTTILPTQQPFPVYNGGHVTALSVPEGGAGSARTVFFALTPGNCSQGLCSGEVQSATVDLALTGDVKIGTTTFNLNPMGTISGSFTATYHSTRDLCEW
jgi:hypothetical protein